MLPLPALPGDFYRASTKDLATSDSTQVQDFYKNFSGPERKKAVTWGWGWGDPRGWGQGNVHHCWRATWGQVEVVGRCLLFCCRRRR